MMSFSLLSRSLWSTSRYQAVSAGAQGSFVIAEVGKLSNMLGIVLRIPEAKAGCKVWTVSGEQLSKQWIQVICSTIDDHFWQVICKIFILS